MDERTPLLQFGGVMMRPHEDPHTQFCMLVGVPPSNAPPGSKNTSSPKSLYRRVSARKSSQNRTYLFTAALSNTLLLSQVVLGAALTALGASESSHVLITVFSATSTIIAGLVAYLKSRGQPMRSRMFRDDLDRVADEIENSEVMWLGIASGVHGYDQIAIDDSVSVRSEVARLTRLYDRAVRSNTMNDPDSYLGTGGTDMGAALRSRPVAGPVQAPPPLVNAVNPASVAVAAPANVVPDVDESPATAAKPSPPKEGPKETSKDNPKEDTKESSRTTSGGTSKAPTVSTGDATPIPSNTTTTDPDESPATARPKPRDSQMSVSPEETNSDPPAERQDPAALKVSIPTGTSQPPSES